MTDTLIVVGIIIGAIVAACAGFVYLTSKYRKAADVEKDKYIRALEDRNEFLEEENSRNGSRLEEVERQLTFLRGLIMGRCPRSQDDGHGGCLHCALGMAYGKAEGIVG